MEKEREIENKKMENRKRALIQRATLSRNGWIIIFIS